MRNLRMRVVAFLVFSGLLAIGGCGSGPGDPESPFRVRVLAEIRNPTRAAFGPDLRLYVAKLDGSVDAITLTDANDVASIDRYEGVRGCPSPSVLGIAFAPRDTDDVRIYVAHAALQGTAPCDVGSAAFTGRVSILTGPSFGSPQVVVSGLPASGRSHGVNGMDFDNNGSLFVAVGGVTNAGVPSCEIGGMDASPFSGALMRFDVRDPAFDGALRYRDRGSAASVDDQFQAGNADWIATPGVATFATGLRNSFDVLFTTQGELFATDNNANVSEGDASLGPAVQDVVPDADDELNRIVQGAYYGHPNRNRGRDVARENVYAGTRSPPDDYTQAITALPPSCNGLAEYRSNAFNGRWRGRLLVQQFNRATYVVDPETGSTEVLPIDFGCLDIIVGPGGTLIGVDFIRQRILIAEPNPLWAARFAGESGRALADVFPWRGPPEGGNRFVLSGRNLQGLSASVSFGGVAAEITNRSATKIRGIVPRGLPQGWVEVSATINADTVHLSRAYFVLD